MVDVLLFHHAQGLTPGVHDFAERLRSAGHQVSVPDLYDGQTFPTVESGVAHAEEIGMLEIVAKGVALAEDLPAGTVYAGLSLGVMPAQKLVQTREGALAGLFFHSAGPATYFAPSWPDGVPAQIHVMEGDEWGADECMEFAAEVPEAELFVYPGADHLFTDSSLAEYDAAATDLVVERSLELLSRWT
jgi:dienelactone hydrolase